MKNYVTISRISSWCIRISRHSISSNCDAKFNIDENS